MIYKELKPSHMTYLLAQIIFESVCVWLNLPRVQRASRAQSVIGRHADRAALCDARAFQIHLHTTMKITVSGARHIYSKPPTRIVRAPDQVIFVFTVHHRLCYMATQVRWCWALTIFWWFPSAMAVCVSVRVYLHLPVPAWKSVGHGETSARASTSQQLHRI